jgi:hypothetical protein
VHTTIHGLNGNDISDSEMCPSGISKLSNVLGYELMSAIEQIIRHLSGDSGFVYVNDNRDCLLFPKLVEDFESNPRVRCTVMDYILPDELKIDSYFEKLGYEVAPHQPRQEEIGNSAEILRKMNLGDVVDSLQENSSLRSIVDNYSANAKTLHGLCKYLYKMGDAEENEEARFDLVEVLNLDAGDVKDAKGNLASAFKVISNWRVLIKEFVILNKETNLDAMPKLGRKRYSKVMSELGRSSKKRRGAEQK